MNKTLKKEIEGMINLQVKDEQEDERKLKGKTILVEDLEKQLVVAMNAVTEQLRVKEELEKGLELLLATEREKKDGQEKYDLLKKVCGIATF